MQKVSDDTLKVIDTKAKLLALAGKSTADAALKAYRSVDESYLDELEDSLIKKKRMLIKSAFALKRRALKGITGFWTNSVNGVHSIGSSIHNVGSNIVQGVHDAAAAVQNVMDQLTLSNAHGVVSNTTSAVS